MAAAAPVKDDTDAHRILFDTVTFTGNLVDDLIFSPDVCAHDDSAAALRSARRKEDLEKKVDSLIESFSKKRAHHASSKADSCLSEDEDENDEKGGGRERRDANNNLRFIRQSITYGGTSNYRRRYSTRKKQKMRLQNATVTFGALKSHRHDWSAYRPKGGRGTFSLPQTLFKVNSSISPLLVPLFREKVSREMLKNLLGVLVKALPDESTEYFEIPLRSTKVQLAAIPFSIVDHSNYKLYAVIVRSSSRLIDFLYVDAASELEHQ